MESEIPTNAPSSCPGTSSLAAGTASGCDGCPNQGLCTSGAALQSSKEVSGKINERFKNIKNVIIVVSGKGGVGKSSVVASLAYGLNSCLSDKSIGVLDLDITGPSVPTMFGCSAMDIHKSQSGWSPVQINDNLSCMSIGFMLENPDQPIMWRDPRKANLITQMLTNINWCDDEDEDFLDYLIIDTPPGTSGEHMTIVNLLKSAGIYNRTSALLVCTPQNVAVSDVQKQLHFFRKVGLKLSGLVENMSEYECRSCHHKFPVFSNSDSLSSMCARENIPIISKIPLDKGVAQCLDMGCSMFDDEEELRDITRPSEHTLTAIEKMVCWVKENIRN